MISSIRIISLIRIKLSMNSRRLSFIDNNNNNNNNNVSYESSLGIESKNNFMNLKKSYFINKNNVKPFDKIFKNSSNLNSPIINSSIINDIKKNNNNKN